ncbi:hypothetical protein J3R82DRAFT_11396 [Butyriboletus roseoflavus]|nr:hypothetical protein J3R82DRAFT_11396 [Butyriboletus roseoflavus]
MSYPTVRLRDVVPRPRYMTSWERVKHTKIYLSAEMVAETVLYFYDDMPTQAQLTTSLRTAWCVFLRLRWLAELLHPNECVIPKTLFTVGTAYSIGVMLAIAVCATTSGGHFNPGVTISFVTFRGFPMRKAVAYVLLVWSHALDAAPQVILN